MTNSPEENQSVPTPPAEAGFADSPHSIAGRIEGLDAARAMAIIGMVMVHFGPNSPPPDTWLALFYGLPHGRASLLFVMLAGIGMTLLVGRRDDKKWGRAWPRIAARVAVLLPLGLGLQLLDIRVFVILHFYALFFLLAIPAALLRDRFLLLLTAVVSVAGPVAYRLIEGIRPEWFWSSYNVALGDPPTAIAQELFFTGSYPAIVWMAPFFFGMWLGRQPLRALQTRLILLIGGMATVVLTTALQPLSSGGGWWELAGTEAHSKTLLWLLQGTGYATAGLALCLISTDLIRRVMWPLIAMGQLALTIYVGHLFLLAAYPATFTNFGVEPALRTVSRFILAAGLFAIMWRRWFARGPIEVLIHGLALGLDVLRARVLRIKDCARLRPRQ